MKNSYIHIRATEEEKIKLLRLSQLNNMTLTQYCRTKLFESEDVNTDQIRVSSSGIKDYNISARVTKQTKDIIYEQAKQSQMSVSKYIVLAALNQHVYIVPGIKEMTHELSKIGTNLNQLTILAHQGRLNAPDLYVTQLTLKNTMKQLIKLQEEKKRK